jgi:hypothetical protein
LFTAPTSNSIGKLDPDRRPKPISVSEESETLAIMCKMQLNSLQACFDGFFGDHSYLYDCFSSLSWPIPAKTFYF